MLRPWRYRQQVGEAGQAPNQQEVGETGQAPNQQETRADSLGNSPTTLRNQQFRLQNRAEKPHVARCALRYLQHRGAGGHLRL
ncbi:MAG: hypothetical protein RBU37_18930 [Myxococcota bacterium]|nr:hypothetical protein [Myxococcota bacterium]